MIKRNESDIGDVVFEILAKTEETEEGEEATRQPSHQTNFEDREAEEEGEETQ